MKRGSKNWVFSVFGVLAVIAITVAALKYLPDVPSRSSIGVGGMAGDIAGLRASGQSGPEPPPPPTETPADDRSPSSGKVRPEPTIEPTTTPEPTVTPVTPPTPAAPLSQTSSGTGGNPPAVTPDQTQSEPDGSAPVITPPPSGAGQGTTPPPGNLSQPTAPGGNSGPVAPFWSPEAPPFVTITSPNGGETLTSRSTAAITWNVFDLTSTTDLKVNVFLSVNSGMDWQSIALGIPNEGAYPWSVPDVEATSALIRVTATDNLQKTGMDVSDRAFAIRRFAGPGVLATSGQPAAGQRISSGWSTSQATGSSGVVRLVGVASDIPLKIDSTGTTLNSVRLVRTEDHENKCTVDIPAGTTMKTDEGAVGYISGGFPIGIPPVPTGFKVIEVESFVPDGAVFDPPVTVSLGFETSNIPAGARMEDMAMAVWDGNKWSPLDAVLDTESARMSANVSRFGVFGVLARMPGTQPLPANFNAISAPRTGTLPPPSTARVVEPGINWPVLAGAVAALAFVWHRSGRKPTPDRLRVDVSAGRRPDPVK